ncbi:hypothetical protein TRFO_42441 [Tritrichomonas foetus]|uniref:Spindle assembly abnormal protein 6 N-terminal domain-containing protein n=1 Tax=Tritrichomonas foetus TaxID=1144522 RepID=A0A1J4KWI6_9EUKA|nr:hypothetical protein TRFO_42441 [Tritrichomonas foetus]|eukprot:OHT15603.1 hypothetical protein TRFO_42441 [Tritrichomonas foetus]
MSYTGSEEQFEEQYPHPITLENFQIHYQEDLVVTKIEQDIILHFLVASSLDGNSIRVEITDENDIYYVDFFEVTPENYPDFIKQQKFKKCKYEQFVENIVRLLENIRTNRSAYRAFYDDNCTLSLQQQLEFKRVEIFKLPFEEIERSHDYTVAQAQFRYSQKLARYEDGVQRLEELFEHVQERNPQLCAQLKKGSKYGQK